MMEMVQKRRDRTHRDFTMMIAIRIVFCFGYVQAHEMDELSIPFAFPVNRIDDIIVFNPLSREDIYNIIDIELEKLYKRLSDLGYEVELTEEAKNFIADKGFDKDYGARPLRRALQKYIEDPMAEEIINSEISEGDKLLIGLNEAKDGVQITVKGKSTQKES